MEYVGNSGKDANGEGERSNKKSKVVNDSVHGHLTLPSYCVDVVDTPQFQRLRDLKQLGVTYFVFPGASHNRFEHCLGVSHLAGKFLKKLDSNSNEPQLVTKREIKLVRLAGLCHGKDLHHLLLFLSMFLSKVLNEITRFGTRSFQSCIRIMGS
jgi:hypothetical protein